MTDVAADLDLTPDPHDGGAERRRRRGLAWLLGAVVIVVGGFIFYRGLTDATVFFRTASEAVADRGQLGDRRFRIEGEVVDGTVRQDGVTTRFDIEESGVTVSVIHDGDPPELFQPGIPVVLEGRWDGDVYTSDRILVRHTNEYEAENSDRLDGTPYVDESGATD